MVILVKVKTIVTYIFTIFLFSIFLFEIYCKFICESRKYNNKTRIVEFQFEIYIKVNKWYFR